MADTEARIAELRKKLAVESHVRDGARLMLTKITNKQARMQCETSIRESQQRLDYLERELNKLEMKRQKGGAEAPPVSGRSSASVSSSSASAAAAASSLGPDGLQMPMQRGVDIPSAEAGQYPAQAAEARPAVASSAAPAKRPLTDLDLRKSESGITTAKVSLKLHEIAFKLDVEKKLREGTDRLARLYATDASMGDKKSRLEVTQKMADSNEKMVLLKRSLQKYQGLYVGEDEVEQESVTAEPPPAAEVASSARAKAAARKPITGMLHVHIASAQNLAHAPRVASTSFLASSTPLPNDTYIAFKVDSVQAARTKASRTQRWNEDIELRVDRASELDITVYDRTGDGREVPVGLLWIRIIELADDLRRMQADMTFHAPGGAVQQQTGVQPTSTATTPHGIEAWWDVEPMGQICMRLDFVRDGGQKRTPSRLGRQGALRMRKDEIHELNGHKFVQRQFYGIMKCAFCSEFLLDAQGYQCDDCRYTCHKRCYPKVVIKCVSRVASDLSIEPSRDDDEDKLNHRIPHRFEPLRNLTANWCCHCGYMLPLGKRDNSRCYECDITCHDYCAPLVPDFCGMSMEMANRMLSEIKAAKRRTKDRRTPAGTINSIGSAQLQSAGSMSPASHSTALLPMVTQVFDPAVAGGQAPVADDGQQRPASMSSMPSRMQMPAIDGYHRPLPPLPVSPRTHQSIMATPQPGISASLVAGGPPKLVPLRRTTLEDFNLLAVLGKGNFGKVMLAEEKKSKNLYAIKVLKKEFIIQNDEVESTKSEKRVFQTANRERHPFLIGLHSCFTTDTRIYFVMEYVNGGDLMWHIQRKQFSEAQAKYYAAEVLLALEYFHRNGIIYRDLKLDNILLSSEGHIKIADYGLCKENMMPPNTTNTFCGTPEFMAPEILLEKRYGRAVDWWAFGVLVYEMLLGQSPFHGDDEEEIFDSILEDEVLYPINMSRDSVAILQKLLTREPEKRLGAGVRDAEEIKEHAFFRNTDWQAMMEKRIPPPYIPKIKSRTDISNFDAEFTKEKPVLTPTQTFLDPVDQAEFHGFSYTADWADQEKGW